jgi:ABC-type ATPase involved in cell division
MATHNYSVLKKFAARTLKCENGIIEEIQENLNVIDFSEFE